MKPVMAAASTAATDDQLVAAIRSGSDEALETLFLRYRDRITAYVRGMVPDQGKAEDIVQETFISALRSLRSSDRTIAFRPWIYQIARNACIDQLRRQQRAQEVSLDSDDFHPQDEGRISQAGQSTHGAVSQREDMYALRQAFGGLPPSQHEVLVLRELEGLSYSEIAARMNLSPAAVESVLFRARRGLKDEYDEIATGERCRRMQPLMAAVAEGLGGTRDRRALARHVRFCIHCRREATALGLGSFVTEALRRGRMKRTFDRAAALIPFPAFLRRRGGSRSPDVSIADRLSARIQAPLANLGVAGPAAENAAGALPKAVAIVAAAALIGGGGIVGKNAGSSAVAAAPLAGAPAALSSTGLPGQPPGSFAGLQGASDPFGSLGGLVRSGETAAAGQVPTGQNGGLIGQGSPGLIGLGAPSGAAGPLGPGGLGGSSGKDGLVNSILGGGGSNSGPSSGQTLGGAVGGTVDEIVPDSAGGISLPNLGGGGGSSSPGGGSTVDKVIDEVAPKVPNVLPKSSTPSEPSAPTQTPTAPSVPQLQVPQTTLPSLQSTPSTPSVPVPTVPQVPTAPSGSLPLG